MSITLLPSTTTATSDTVDAIITNIEAVLVGLGLSLEDLSGDDIPTTPLAVLSYEGEEFDDSFGERPYYNTATFSARVMAAATTPDTDRDVQRAWVHALKNALTVSALNIGDLVASKLVARVDHTGPTILREGKILIVDYDFGVKYRVTT